jgi:hypothetical protein
VLPLLFALCSSVFSVPLCLLLDRNRKAALVFIQTASKMNHKPFQFVERQVARPHHVRPAGRRALHAGRVLHPSQTARNPAGAFRLWHDPIRLDDLLRRLLFEKKRAETAKRASFSSKSAPATDK